MIIRSLKVDDIISFKKCYLSIWNSLRGILPDKFVAEAIEDVSKTLFSDRLVAAIEDPKRIMLVAEENDEIIGLAQGRTNKGGYSWLGFMGVSPEKRRMGIARRILEEFISYSKNEGCTKVSLNTAPTLKPAIKLYTEMGFIPEGYMRNHMHGLDLIFYSLFF